MSNGNALAKATDGGIAANVQSVLEAQSKIGRLLTRVNEDFRGAVVVQAKEIAAVTDIATFNVDGFVTPWLQQTEQFRNKTLAFKTFRAELRNVINTYEKENALELIAALQARRNALQADLDKRNEADAALAAQIAEINEYIAHVTGYGGYPRPLSPLEELRADIERRFDETQQETSAELYEVLLATRERIEAELKQRTERDVYHEQEIARLKQEIEGLRYQSQTAAQAAPDDEAAQAAADTTKSQTPSGKKASKKR